MSLPKGFKLSKETKNKMSLSKNGKNLGGPYKTKKEAVLARWKIRKTLRRLKNGKI
jgi:hypothetical protein